MIQFQRKFEQPQFVRTARCKVIRKGQYSAM